MNVFYDDEDLPGEFDQDVWLDQLRQIVHEWEEAAHYLPPPRVNDMMIFFDTLDDHLRGSGRLPIDWQPKPRRKEREVVDLPPLLGAALLLTRKRYIWFRGFDLDPRRGDQNDRGAGQILARGA